MRLRARLTLVVTLVAIAAVAVTALLSVQVATRRVGRLLETSAASGGPVAGVPQAGAGIGRGPATNRAGAGPPDSGGATLAGPAGAASRRTALVRDLWRANAQAAAIALLMAAAAGTLLAARLSRPLKRLTEVTDRYASGERTARANATGRDEVAEVGAAFNALADRLQAEESQQQRLIADIAHELRTPLTVLRGELEALEDGLQRGDAETYRRLGEEVTLLTRLVQDLRLLSQAESGALSLERGRVDLRALVAEVAASFRAHARGSGPALATDLDSAHVNGDADRLKQVLVNLLDNAARHAPDGSRIDVTLRREGERAILRVRDRGPGIPEGERERIFQRFYRTDGARTRATGGSGLGLSIVHSLVTLHGGTVTADDHPEGGAVLSVSLPLARGAVDGGARDQAPSGERDEAAGSL
ncbi:MAG TPA: ATP-binding protein [Trueperaceae bacterium]|nr:ATP-binding protein [Trueperaceae bacterium]